MGFSGQGRGPILPGCKDVVLYFLGAGPPQPASLSILLLGHGVRG